MAGQRQHDGGGEALGRQLDRRRQHLVEGQPPVALVQREPAVDRAGHLHAADVAPQRHGGHPLGAHPGRVGPGAGPPDGEERLGRRSRHRDHGQHVAPEPAQVRADDRHHRPGGHGGVGRRAALRQHGEARRRGQLVGGGHHAAQAGPWSEGGEGEGHARIVRPRSAPGMVWTVSPRLRGGGNGHSKQRKRPPRPEHGRQEQARRHTVRVPKERKEPLVDAEHVRNAWRFDQVEG